MDADAERDDTLEACAARYLTAVGWQRWNRTDGAFTGSYMWRDPRGGPHRSILGAIRKQMEREGLAPVVTGALDD